MQNIPLPDETVDLAYARFAACFSTPDCLPGLDHIMRVLKTGGDFCIVDVIPERGEWGQLARKAHAKVFTDSCHRDQVAFYGSLGLAAHRVETCFCAPNRKALDKVLAMDYPHMWSELTRQIVSLDLTSWMAVFHRRKHE